MCSRNDERVIADRIPSITEDLGLACVDIAEGLALERVTEGYCCLFEGKIISLIEGEGYQIDGTHIDITSSQTDQSAVNLLSALTIPYKNDFGGRTFLLCLFDEFHHFGKLAS